MSRQPMEVAVYRGDELLAIGTVKECAEKLKVLPSTISFYLTPTYKRRIARRGDRGDYQNQMAVVRTS